MLQVKPMSTTFEAVEVAKTTEPVVAFPKLESPPTTVQKQEVATNNSFRARASAFFTRLRKVKNIEIYAVAILVVVMIGIYISSFDFGGRNDRPPSSSIHANDNFAREMEVRLESTLASVRGAGRVQAMVTVVGSPRLEIAYNEEERTITQAGPNGQTTTTTTIVRTPILNQNREPVIIMTTKPRVTGVVIVSQGANDPQVRLQLLRAVQTLIQDVAVRVEIVTGR